jgi:type IV pilus assembly protein PilW
MATTFGGNRMISRNRGFGLIEILVGLVVGLVTMIVIMQVGSVFEGQKRAITSGGDAQTNGALAMYMMEREVRTAGNGMTEGVPLQFPPLAGCSTQIFDTAAFLAPNNNPAATSTLINGGQANVGIRLAPVLATDGGGGNPDSLTVIYGNSSITAPYDLANPFTPSAQDTIGLNSSAGIANGDVVAVVDRATANVVTATGTFQIITPQNCGLFQVTQNPAAAAQPGEIQVARGTRYNASGGNGVAAYTNNASLYNLGHLTIVTYRINGGNLVADISRFGTIPDANGNRNPVTNRTDFAPVAANIVNMQVQYGIDTGNPLGTIQQNCSTRSPNNTLDTSHADSIVDAWVDPTNTAAGQWANNPAANTPALLDLQRVRAVRVGLVARSGVKEPPNKTTGVCDTTTTAPVISWNTGPNMALNLAADPDWQCYRYKVFQTTIPVRNALWSSTMNPASAASCRGPT